MKTRYFIITILLFLLTPTVLAIDLIGVYKQALASDPTFKAAYSQWLAERETLAINRSAFFPNLSATGSVSKAHYITDGVLGAHNDRLLKSVSYSLTLTQTIFNFGDWANLFKAQAIVKKAEVTYMAAAESLLFRTAKAYFDVLQSKDILSYTKAHKKALEQMLDQQKHKFDVGLIAIVDLENTRADYDKAVADEIAATNDLADKLELLNEITGVKYLSLNQVKQTFPLLSPQPSDIEKWVKAAEKQNFELAAARYATILAREEVKLRNAGHLPTLTASGKYAYSYTNDFSSINSTPHSKTLSGEIDLNIPLFQGGQVVAEAKQANYQYQKSLSDKEIKYRSTISLTRQAYLGVLSNISKIKANRQAIKSNQSSLRATKAGYEAGTRTMVDILTAQAKLYETQKNFAISEYDYILQLLQLKQYTGILDFGDLVQINKWLEKPTLTNNIKKNSNGSDKKKNNP